MAQLYSFFVTEQNSFQLKQIVCVDVTPIIKKKIEDIRKSAKQASKLITDCISKIVLRSIFTLMEASGRPQSNMLSKTYLLQNVSKEKIHLLKIKFYDRHT